MHRALCRLTALGAVALATLSLAAARSAAAAGSATSSGESSFALSLLGRLAGPGNLVYSPYSIYTALAMADAGAAGQTASQIDRVLAAPSHGAAIADGAALQRAITAAVHGGPQAPTLDTANALWTQSGVAFEQPFISTLSDQFGAPPRSTDFAASPAAALEAINAWVAMHTNNLIRALLAPGSIGPQTTFVLANAIYLKAHWESPFVASRTQPAPFTSATGTVVRVPFMNQPDTTYRYAAGAGYQAVALPYSSSSLSLLAILPRAQTLAALERGLTPSSLAAIVARLAPHAVTLALPKLNLSTQSDLDRPLTALGMRDAFGSAADFSAMTKQRALDISLVEHAADLKLDEQGTVAAGATVIVGPTAIARPPTGIVTLRFDHPFLLLLRDDASGAILFVAQVENPSEH